MGFQSIYTDRSDREDVFDGLLQSGIEDPVVDNHKLSKLFNHHAGCVEMYIRTGWNDVIDSLENESNAEDFAFLNSLTDDGENTLLDVIKQILQ